MGGISRRDNRFSGVERGGGAAAAGELLIRASVVVLV